MKKNDKIVVMLGVVILVLASIGVYFYDYDLGAGQKIDAIEDISSTTGTYKEDLNGYSITVADTNPFYALVATPLAVHYDNEGHQEKIPLYVKNYSHTSEAIDRLQNTYLLNYKNIDLAHELDWSSTEEFSLAVAEKYWKDSEIALIIENNKDGYFLGVNAVPIASYLSIPVIVSNEMTSDVQQVLDKLGVKSLIVCGNVDLDGKNYNHIKYDSVEEIVEDEINLLIDKFGSIDYLALTNPIDAYDPNVLDSEEKYFGSGSDDWSFEIPRGYKYARVKVEATSDEPMSFRLGADLKELPSVLQEMEITDGGHAIPVRDEKGNILRYNFYRESVVYGREGVTYKVSGPKDVTVKVTIEKIDHPVNAMMKKLSTLAPYLASCHHGLVFGKTSFAFTANDTLRNDNGQKIPGYYMPRFNPELTPLSNKHIYDNVHLPINEVLSKIADISLSGGAYTKDIEHLHDYYRNKDFSIALVGGATVLPQYTYQNLLEPFGDVDGDGTDDTTYGMGGGGTPSDVIYGNIDPVKYDWSNMAQDIYTDLPQMENVVGRITGWDVQDADALVLKSLFYNDIIDNLVEWKENFAVLIGDGQDFRKPFVRYMLEKVTGLFSLIKNVASKIPATAGLVNFMDSNGPWKHETGYSELNGLRTIAKAEEVGFEVKDAWDAHAMIEGYTQEELNEVKNSNLLYRLFLKTSDLEEHIGKQVVKGGEYMEQSNYIFANAHGAIGTFGMGGPDLVSTGIDIRLIPGKWIQNTIRWLTPIGGGWLGPGFGLENGYTPRSVTGLELGPSFMFLESCTCGKIDGVYPQQNVGQALLHAGAGALVASTTGSNIGGGYLPGTHEGILGNHMWDTPLSVAKARREWEKKAEQGIYIDPHFGYKIYEDMVMHMGDEDSSVGEALMHAKNNYLPYDIDWKLWWTPPLSSGEDKPDVYGPHKEAKYTSYYEFTLYGDPGFNPYEPSNEG